jgi:hypothetical protein
MALWSCTCSSREVSHVTWWISSRTPSNLETLKNAIKFLYRLTLYSFLIGQSLAESQIFYHIRSFTNSAICLIHFTHSCTLNSILFVLIRVLRAFVGLVFVIKLARFNLLAIYFTWAISLCLYASRILITSIISLFL